MPSMRAILEGSSQSYLASSAMRGSAECQVSLQGEACTADFGGMLNRVLVQFVCDL